MYSKRFWYNKIGILSNQIEVRRVFQIKDNFLSIIRFENHNNNKISYPQWSEEISYGVCIINILKPNITFFGVSSSLAQPISETQIRDILKNGFYDEFLKNLTWIYQPNEFVDRFVVLNYGARKRA